MAKFNFEVVETNAKVITVEAETIEDAHTKAYLAYEHGEIDMNEQVDVDYTINRI